MPLPSSKSRYYGDGLLALTSASCAGPAGQVSVLQSQQRQITPGAAVAWAPLTADEKRNGDPRIDNDIMRERIRTAVESALVARGHHFVQDVDDAQYTVSYYVGLQNRQDYRVDTMAPGGGVACGWRGCIAGHGWGMYGAPADVRTVQYVDGTMMLDLTDRASGQLAWRATSQRRVDEDDGSQERISATVADMVQTLP